MASLKEIIESLEGRGFDMGMTRALRGEARTKAGYPSGGRIAGETARKMFVEKSSQLPYTQDIFGPIPDQYFDPETKLGSGVNEALRQAAGVGYAAGDSLVRAPLQAVYNVGRMYDALGRGIGEYAMLPTDRKQKEISDEIGQFTRAQIPRDTVDSTLPPGLDLDDELSQLSAALAEKRIPKQTQAEREEMEELSGVPTGSRGSGEFLPELSEEVQAIMGAAEKAGGGEQAGAEAGGDGSTTTTTTKKTTTQEGELGAMGPDGAPGDTGVDISDPYTKYVEDAMKEVAEASGADTSAKTKEDYMKEFAEATGVSIDGKADKSHALMAFGLALMQNKAGKGFNVGEMLGAVGAAGEKAMPAFEKAKDRARAERIAAGKYALGEVSKDEAQRIANAAAAKERLADFQMKQLDFRNERLLKEAEWQNDRILKNAELRADAIKAQNEADKEAGKITNPWNEAPVVGMNNLKVRKGYSPTMKTDVFYDGDGTAEKFGIAYGNTMQALAEIDNLEQLFTDIQNSPEGATTRILLDRGKSLIANLGFGAEDLFQDVTYKDFKTGKNVTIKGISAESSAQAIQDAILAQYKRFLSQETGNGISEGDFQRLNQLVGQLNAFGNINENKARLDELREFFMTPKRQIESVLAELGDRRNYISEDEYIAAQEKLQDVFKTSVGALQITTTVGDDGITTYDVR
jgi:hypothetical protein